MVHCENNNFDLSHNVVYQQRALLSTETCRGRPDAKGRVVCWSDDKARPRGIDGREQQRARLALVHPGGREIRLHQLAQHLPKLLFHGRPRGERGVAFRGIAPAAVALAPVASQRARSRSPSPPPSPGIEVV